MSIQGFRLSPQQKRLWALGSALRSASQANVLRAQCAIDLEGELDAAALQRALGRVVERHSVLRTSLRRRPGLKVPLQVIEDDVSLVWRELDLSVAGAASSASARAAFTDVGEAPFRYAEAPLVRLLLMRLAPRRHRLTVTLPALCADAPSLHNVFAEIGELYAGRASGNGDGDLVQYLDFSEWQLELAESDDADAQEYWAEKLTALDRSIEMPWERHGVDPVAFVPRRVPVAVESGVTAALEVMSGQGVAAEVFFLACFKLFLGRLAQRAEVPVGVVAEARSLDELAPALGAFAKTLPLLTRLGRTHRFEELVKRLAENLEESREQQDLLSWNEPRVPDGWPMEFELRRRPGPARVEALSLSLAEEYVCTGPFKLKLLVVEEARAPRAELWYDAARFDAVAAANLARQLAALFTAASGEPHGLIWELGMLPAAERQRRLVEWNDVGRPPAPCRPVPASFTARVARHPERVAAFFEDEVLSYGELGARASRLGRHLRSLGLGPEDRVALLDERSSWFLVGILAVLEAGGAYVPLDPSHPREQIAAMLEGVRFVVTRPRFLEKLADLPVAAILPDTARQGAADSRTAGEPPRVRPGALAYVLFTSGSTGRPKGVAIEHRALTHYVAGAVERLGIDDGRSFAMVSTFAADLGHTMLFPALVTGGRLHVVAGRRTEDPDAFAEYVDGRRIDFLKIVPSHLRALLSASRPERALPRRCLVLGGEALRAELSESLRRLAPACRIFNHYGPTEATVGASAGEARPRATSGNVALGRPLAGSEVWLLDARTWPVGAMVAGQIHLGGTGLARGYLGRPGLTAERFVPHPLSLENDQRLYKTGDLARFTPAGELEFLGRVDHQVKLRGFRVELGAVEAVLAAHPAVAEAVATVRQDRPGERRLVAYLVAARRAPVDLAEVTSLVRAKLPEPMVPANLVLLESLPLTANGKVDRRALPKPEARSAARRFVAPRTAAEKRLAEVWADVLGRKEFGVHDSFFELGGDSIQAIQLVARAQRAGLALEPREVFRKATIAQLALVAEASGTGEGEAASIPRQSRERPLPLSFAQERLWFLHRLRPESPAYNVPRALRFDGTLSPVVLAAVLDEVVRRHEVLRTTFTQSDGDDTPFQVVGRARRVPMPIVDLTRLAADARRRLTENLASAAARRPFDLGRGPILRTLLLRLGDHEHVVLFTLHHIASDAWSTLVLVREVMVLYSALASGEAPRLPELPIQYADFACWQRQQLSGELLAGQLEYWRRRLAEAPPALELPTDRVRGTESRALSGRVPWRLPAALTRALAALGRARDASLFMTLLATWQVLLGRYSGQDDVSVGVPVANRDRGETEHLIGLFLNTLVFRADLAGRPRFDAFVDQVRQTALEAYTHQDLPFEKLVAELEPERSLRQTPLFQVMLVLENVGRERLELPGMTIEPFAVADTAEKFDFTLWSGESEDGLEGYLSYDAALFDRTTAARVLGHLATLLAGAVSEPSRRVSSLPLLGPAEAHQVQAEWGGEAAGEPPSALLHELWTVRAAEIGEASALVSGDRWWSYDELERRSQGLARVLEARGSGPEVPVAALVDRSPEMALALLAVLRAGAVYVPLDPAYPRRRLAEILAGVRPCLVLVPERLRTKLPEWTGRVVDLDAPDGSPAATASGGRNLGLRPENLACVFHTSGSTGHPKGVAGTHRGASAYLLDLVRQWELGPAEVTLQLAAPGFDAMLRDLLGPLAAGARVVLAGEEGARDPEAVLDLVRRQRISCLPSVVPSQLTDLLRAAGAGARPDRLRLVLASGEVLPAASFDAARRVFGPGLTLVNQYGPTESTMTASRHVLRSAPAAGNRVPIGRGLPYVGLRVTDRHLTLVPARVWGELLVAGPGVARGYLGQPVATAMAFVPDPGAEKPGRRAYRTGDRVRFLDDGRLDYLGRLDRQVKLRGIRLEPGEVEAVLRRHPAVAEAAVTVQKDRAGEPVLAAYAVAAHETSRQALRQFLRARLPAWAVPGAVVFLDVLPRTATGKLDRRALPAPERAPRTPRSAAPRHPAEEMLTSIWAEVLGLDRVGTDEDFFELGGHSLLAVQVRSRIRQRLGVELPLRELFEAPTVAELARRIDVLETGRQGFAPPPPLEPAPEGTALEVPLSFAQERLWLLDRLAPGNPAYNLPSALHLRGRLDRRALERSFTEVVRRHGVLRTTFHTVDAQPCQRVAPPRGQDLPLVDLGALGEAERWAELRHLAGSESRFAFELDRGPLLRTVLVRLGAVEHAILVTQHHIVSDGWSIGLLVGELGALYGAFAQGRPSPLDPPRLRYTDYALWQRRWLRGEALARRIAWWRRRLAGVGELELPTDRARPASRAGRGARRQRILQRVAPSLLTASSREARATPFMVLLAVWTVLLQRYSGQRDLAVGTPVAHRNRTEVEGLIGFFVNTLVLRTKIAPCSTMRDLIARTREAALAAFAHQDVPFEKLVAELEPRRDLSRQPLFQVMFALQNVPRVSLELPGLTLKRLPNEVRTARFDLTLALTETTDGLLATLDYDTDLFDGVTLRRLLGHYETLAVSALGQPDQPIAELTLLDAGQRHQVLVEWAIAEAEANEEATLHGLFEARARRRRDAVALVDAASQTSYGELDRRAAHLAGLLRGWGVGPDEVVGLEVERRAETVVRMLAILKAGGAYLPLDPALPDERSDQLVRDAGARLVLRWPGRLDRAPVARAPVARAPVARAPVEARPIGINLAYVIYTSGSTGEPKGVMVPHRSICHTLLWRCRSFALTAGERVLQNVPMTFDPSLWQIFGPLISGGLLVLDHPGPQELPRLLKWMVDQRITITDFPPSMLEVLLQGRLFESCPALGLLFVGGELLSAALEETFLARSDAALYNVYGPTEGAVDAASWHCRGGSGTRGVPIGRPAAYKRLRLLDSDLSAVPAAVPGELFVGGALARGYLGRPAASAERFLADPFAAEPGRRLYRTGDLARYRSDGALEFLGRTDRQVKLRGLRIEPEEIEAVLTTHPRAREAAVVVDGKAGDQRLVAYVGGNGEKPPPDGELDAFLRRRLPAYMVPAAFVWLERLPLSAHGKIDRRALPRAPRATRPEREETAPRSELERTVAAAWGEVLGRGSVGVFDNFFELGGHSLLLVRLHARLSEALEQEIPIVDLFQYPTVSSLARHLSRRRGGEAEGAFAPELARARKQRQALENRQQALLALRKARSSP